MSLDFENSMIVKKANVEKNRFSVIYTKLAIREAEISRGTELQQTLVVKAS